jgi:thioredoxin-dependent peroxiredoxin
MKMETLEIERTGVVKSEGRPLTLVGQDLKEGDIAPEFTVINTDFQTVKLSDFKNKVVVISSFPSIDTPVCKRQTMRFSEEMGKASEDVVILSISMDLPFALKRWQKDTGHERMIMLSDHREADFAHKYGLLIKELKLLARGITVIDKNGVIRYRHIVTELTTEPNYRAAFETVSKLLEE